MLGLFGLTGKLRKTFHVFETLQRIQFLVGIFQTKFGALNDLLSLSQLFIFAEAALHQRPRVLHVSPSFVVFRLSLRDLTLDLRLVDQVIALDILLEIQLSKFERLFGRPNRCLIFVDLDF